jgi:hypothetical protein
MSKTKSRTKSITKSKTKSRTKSSTKSKIHIKKHTTKNYTLKNNIIEKKKNNKIKIFTARIIIQNNIGGVVVDKNTIKEIIENIGGIVEVVIFNDIKNDINIKNKMHSKVKFDKVNIQFFIEHINLEYPLDIFPAEKSYLFINQEYIQDWDIARMQDKTVTPLCKTQEGLKTVHKLGIMHAKFVGYGDNVKYKYIDSIDKLQNVFIHIVGFSPMKGTRILIDTWIAKNIRKPLIIIANNQSSGNFNLFKYWKTLNAKVKPLPKSILNKWDEWIKLTNIKDITLPQFETLNSCDIYFCGILVDYNIIKFFQTIADVHMCPSVIEGWGQYLDEGRRSKSVVLTLDAPPMNELITDNNTDNNTGESTGILVKAYKGLNMRQILPYGWTQYFTKNHEYNKFLYGTYKTTIDDLYNGITRILKMTPKQKKQIGNNAIKQSQIDYDIFKTNFINLILDTHK